MELFAKLFDSLLVFVYHCFDRVVITVISAACPGPSRWSTSSARFWACRW